VPLKARGLHTNLPSSYVTGKIVSEATGDKRMMTGTVGSPGDDWTIMQKLATRKKSLTKILGACARGQTVVEKGKNTPEFRNPQKRTVNEFSDLFDEKIQKEYNAHPNINIQTKVRKYNAHPNINIQTKVRKYNAHPNINIDKAHQELKKLKEPQSLTQRRKSKMMSNDSGPRILLEPSKRKPSSSPR
jgi:hypothetical protein